MGQSIVVHRIASVVSISRNNLFLVRKMAKGRKGKSKAAVQVERAPEEDLAETNQDHTEDANVPGPSPKIKKAKKGKAVPEIAGGDGAENETVSEELKPSEPSPKAKKGKKNAKALPEKQGEEEDMAAENGAIHEGSAPSKEADDAPVLEELKPSEPSPKKKGKKNAKTVPENNVEEEASTSDVKPVADEPQIVATDIAISIPKESLQIKQQKGEDDAENTSVPEDLTPPKPSAKAKKGKKNTKNVPEKKIKKKNEVTKEVAEDVDTNEAVSAKDPEEGADAVEDMEVSSETVDSTTKASEEVDEKVEDVKKPSKRATKRNATASVAVKEEVEEEEKVPSKKTKAAPKKGSTKAKEKIETVEEKPTKRANKRNPSPTEVEAEKDVPEKAKPVNKKGAPKAKAKEDVVEDQPPKRATKRNAGSVASQSKVPDEVAPKKTKATGKKNTQAKEVPEVVCDEEVDQAEDLGKKKKPAAKKAAAKKPAAKKKGKTVDVEAD